MYTALRDHLIAIPFYRLGIALVIFVALVLFFYWVDNSLNNVAILTQNTIEILISSAGVYAWLVFVCFVALLVVTPFPSSALGVIGGYLFSPVVAILLMLLGELIGAAINFLIGRELLGRYFKRGRWPRVEANVAKQTKRLNGLSIFILGMVPAGTTNVTAYAAGFAGMRFRNFIGPWLGGVGLLSLLTILLGRSALLDSPVLSGGIIVILISVFFGLHTFTRPGIDQTEP